MQGKKETFDIDTLMEELMKLPNRKLQIVPFEDMPAPKVNPKKAAAEPQKKKLKKRRPSETAADADFPVPISQPASDFNNHVKKPEKKNRQVFIVKKQKHSEHKELIAGPGIQEKYTTPNMDTPLSELRMNRDILAALNRVGINDVGDLCMIRKNGLERYHILTGAELSALCSFMEGLHVSLI